MADDKNLTDMIKDAVTDKVSSGLNSSSTTTSSSGTGVRKRKGQSLGGAIAGVFLGILLIFISPFVLWAAESQDSAKRFMEAERVEATSSAEGYIVMQAEPVVEALSCADGQECLYYHYKNQVLTTVQEEQCGNISDDARVIEKSVIECNEDGEDCQQCYLVERDVWETVSEQKMYSTVELGSYEVELNDTALFLGTEEVIIDLSDTTRDVWSILEVPEELLVAGDARGQVIEGSAEHPYVVSAFGYEQTLSTLEARDAVRAWLFRGITLLLLLIGYSGILGPIRYFTHALRKIPLIGDIIKGAGAFVVGLVAAVLATITFAILWLLITLLKNILLVAAVVLVVGGGIFWYVKKK